MSIYDQYSADALKSFETEHDSFVGIDSDGCVFDTMEIKQKQCFHGLIVQSWKLRAIDQEVRQTAEFVNLYSRSRGQNRFTALRQTFELLAQRPEVLGSDAVLPDHSALNALIDSGVTLDNKAVARAAYKDDSSFLRELLAWSLAVNELIERKVQRIPPFPWAAKSLELMQNKSDLMVVSQTPLDALVREWDANNMLNQIQFIAGQEIGTKTEHLAMATRGRYAPSRVLMIGDAAGDRVAAEASGAWFYPINPGQEDDSWKRFHDETYGRFMDGSFDPAYQQRLNAEFDALLPENPSWETTAS